MPTDKDGLFRRGPSKLNPQSVNVPCCNVLGQCTDCGYDTPENRIKKDRELKGEKVEW